MPDTSASWPATKELADLVRDAQSDNSRGLNALLRTLRRPILRFFERRLSHDDAEDLTQVALVRIANALHRIDPDRADRYIRAVARNLLRSTFQLRAKEAARITSLVDADEVDSGEDIEALVEYHELLEIIERSSRAALPDPLREIVRGCLRGESLAEIADQQMINPITIRTRLLRARAILRLYLESSKNSR